MNGLVVLLALLLVGCGVNAAERNNAGVAAIGAGQAQDALDALQLAQVADPDNPIPYYNAGIALAQSGRLQEAIITLQYAQRSGNSALVAAAYYNLGNVYFELGFYDLAVEAYRQTLLLHPDDADARYNYELAQSLLLAPTPTAQEQETLPESGESDPEATPTPDTALLVTPTPLPAGEPDFTQTPAGGTTGSPGGSQPNPVPPVSDNPMTTEEAERLLDSARQDQPVYRPFTDTAETPTAPGGKDW